MAWRPTFSLTSIAAFSFAIGLVFVFGYVGSVGVGYVSSDSPVIGQPSQTIYCVFLENGLISFTRETRFRAPGISAPITTGLHYDIQGKISDFYHSLWGFSASSLDVWRTGGSYVLSVPVWCVLLPCLIAPVRWLRQYKKHDAMGFAVVGNPST